MGHGMQDLSFLDREQTHPPAAETQSPHHWTIREFPEMELFLKRQNSGNGQKKSGFQQLRLGGRNESVQISSFTQSCLTLCDPMNRSTPGLPVHHQLPEFTQTHVHRVGDAIQPSYPLSSPSSPAPNPSQHPSQSFPMSQLFT